MRPTPLAVQRWVAEEGVDSSILHVMAEDLWTTLALKIQGPGQAILDQMDRINVDLVTKISMTWFEFLREASGRLQDRKMGLTQLVIYLRQVKSWSEVGDAYRRWETAVREHEEIVGAPLDDSVKTSAFFKFLPSNLREQTQTQANLEHSFLSLRLCT